MLNELNSSSICKTPSEMRFSGIELFRIIAILFIVLHHGVQTATYMIDMSSPTFFNVLLLSTDRLGGVGNIFFVICSSFFLADGRGAKPEKAIKILLDSTFISIIVFLCMTAAGFRFSAETIVWQFFPDVNGNVWFVPAYVLFYIAHPFANNILKKTNKKQHLALIVATICLHVIIVLLFDSASFFEFLILFEIIAYVKKYQYGFCKDKKLNLILFFVFLSLYTAWTTVSIVFNMPEWTKMVFLYSPIVLPWAICMFNLFNSLDFKSKTVNYFSSCSLFVYCIHENALLRSYIRPLYYNYAFGISFDLYPLWILLCGLGMFVCGFLLAILYKETLSRLTQLIVTKGRKLFDKVLDRAEARRAKVV